MLQLPAGRRIERQKLLFLSWDCPWPPRWGGAVRTFGLLTELSRYFSVDLLLLTPRPLTDRQRAALGVVANSVTAIPLRGVAPFDRARITARALLSGLPYHSAAVEASIACRPQVYERILAFDGPVFASHAQWAVLVGQRAAPNWIIDEQHAAADMWRVYAKQVSSPWLRLAALVNWRLARRHFAQVLPRVGRVISVCEEDRRLKRALSPRIAVDVIENGVDCRFYMPNTTVLPRPASMLFIGTPSARNIQALQRFVREILPRVRRAMPDMRLTVVGDFGPRARAGFASDPHIVFTGAREDLRDVLHRSDVFVVPHMETHGSQTKVALAMAMGMGIVSTPGGIRGFPLVHGASVFIAEDDDTFAAHIVRLAIEPELRAELGQAARQAAVERLDWHVLGDRVSHIVDSIAREPVLA